MLYFSLFQQTYEYEYYNNIIFKCEHINDIMYECIKKYIHGTKENTKRREVTFFFVSKTLTVLNAFAKHELMYLFNMVLYL